MGPEIVPQSSEMTRYDTTTVCSSEQHALNAAICLGLEHECVEADAIPASGGPLRSACSSATIVFRSDGIAVPRKCIAPCHSSAGCCW